MSDESFYSAGLRFSCTRCSNCCRKESGFVYLSENDLSRLAGFFDMDYTAFIQTWCRWVSFERNRERLSLKEKSNYDCIFWDKVCTVYNVRPLQCRTFPFWDSVLCSKDAWENTGQSCPGINTGDLHEKGIIDNHIRLMEEELVVERIIHEWGVA
ncbi:MAG: YkgJ family cysteine cluster protein [Treponema sp.]|nr:YkgJ family cysteine cluster protein [Treponema sp.]